LQFLRSHKKFPFFDGYFIGLVDIHLFESIKKSKFWIIRNESSDI